jgi:hypothetical protein
MKAEKIDDGGNAFVYDGFGRNGMSLRDYFAASALTGLMANNELLPNSIDAACGEAYSYADAMLKERSK